MISLDLSPVIEKNFIEVVKSSYKGDFQTAILSLIELHRKYGWKEQLRRDVNAVRTEVNLEGGIKAEEIDNAIKKYRKIIVNSGG